MINNPAKLVITNKNFDKVSDLMLKKIVNRGCVPRTKITRPSEIPVLIE